MSPKQSLEPERLHEAKQALSPSHHIAKTSLTQRVQTLALAIFLACCCFTVTNALSSHELLSIEDRVDRILSRTPLIDGHNDLPIFVRENFKNRIYQEDFTAPFTQGGFPGHVDIPRLSEGKVGGTFWSVFVGCPANGSDFSDDNYAKGVRETVEQIDVMTRLQQAYPDTFSTPPNGTTARQAFEDGKIISPLGVEGLHSIGNSLAYLRDFHARGVSYATLTHNCHNRYADAAVLSTPDGGVKRAEPLWHGVSPAGQQLVLEMNRLGMIVDLSHVSADTMRDVLGAGEDGWAGSRAPVMFSHSSAYALCPHPRNVPDDVLDLVRQRNSIVMVNFSPSFIACVASDQPDGIPDPDPAHETLARVAEHIVYIGERAGFDHVGLGSDFDGIPTVPHGLEDVSKFPALVAELLRRGVSDADAAKVVGGNLLRVWAEVDQVALEMRKEGALPAEDDLS
ncbi:dipeptidase [Aspergillus campestris IBT 28561]|uniref:Dipeptidase n=1 Tax=Aspergillus campestris (strain IBT 28561) TaxID=1392248 RepID=A0A2I1DHL5_ASPC2|nr:dipeptidase [Aspergillus campestris IBT 28561]PKY09358.1 dipeptidase [Aspergillus campestris IBT 28561]